jgi:regulator of replication initiation timing
LAVAVFNHVQDLYDINEISLTALAVLKDEIDDVVSKNKSVEEMNRNLKKRFDTTLGSLEDRLKQINDKDESKKEEPGEFTFYG